ATLKSLGEERGAERRIAVLGPMRETGVHSAALHAGLASAISQAKVDQLILIGAEMDPLAEALGGAIPIERAADADSAAGLLEALIAPGDVVLVKASNSVGLAALVERVAGGVACST
ncbi:MAG: UDP-N-acetylmuramoylalanyl-D-glutamyl-2, 6-diaminopimelate--D-alanyl-D-alanine ligase, partial [Pseudomonadota bacterium]|nr:UDP-N-acetylmuramoylalanyl-D-glutamyl-2, 6-diaminopimelate--D-alanyl-D-alanine ligase [Pseudomonadota bacterium]